MFNEKIKLSKAEIVAIGNEVVSGLIADGNSRFLSNSLHSLGIDVARINSIGDNHEEIRDCLRSALERVDIVIVTGGLGSTHDDITKKVLADLFNAEMTLDEGAFENLENIMQKRGKPMTERFKRQAEVPSIAKPLYNDIGSAPGLLIHQASKRLFALPGVPREMMHLYDKYIRPELAKENNTCILHRLIKTTGLSESEIWNRIDNLEELEQWVTVASLPSYYGVNIRLSSIDLSIEEAQSKLEKAESWLNPFLKEAIYAYDDENLEETVGKLLLQKKMTVALAESCTGGLIGHRLTEVSGSSKYFIQGITAYSNSAKTKLLNVPDSCLSQYGAVSEETAKELAKGARNISGADFGLSTTGIAGPGGGTKDKPVGLVYIGLSDKNETLARKYLFHDDRSINKIRTSQAALNLLRLKLI